MESLIIWQPRFLFFDERSKELELIKKSDLRAFYRFVNKRLTPKSDVGPLRPAGTCDVFETDDSKKASMLYETPYLQ